MQKFLMGFYIGLLTITLTVAGCSSTSATEDEVTIEEQLEQVQEEEAAHFQSMNEQNPKQR